MNEPVIYLAGPITGLYYDEATDWRAPQSDFVARLEALGWEVRSPMRDKEEFKIKGRLSPYFDEGDAAVRRDLQDIRDAAIVLLNVKGAERVSLGSMAEMGYAFAQHKFIIGVREEGNPHGHIFMDFMCDRIETDLESALLRIVEYRKRAREPQDA